MLSINIGKMIYIVALIFLEKDSIKFIFVVNLPYSIDIKYSFGIKTE